MNDGEEDLDSLRLTLSPPDRIPTTPLPLPLPFLPLKIPGPPITPVLALTTVLALQEVGAGAACPLLPGPGVRAGDADRDTEPGKGGANRSAVSVGDRAAGSCALAGVLAEAGILAIRGDLVCKRCDGKESREVDLQAGFLGLSSFFLGSKDTMHDRAPKVWMVPRLLDCGLCHQSDCVKPVIDDKKRRINWLFLLLTQTLGLCTLDQLKYFCKHTKKHRTGAKDRVLYLTYAGLLKQLNPSGPYE